MKKLASTVLVLILMATPVMIFAGAQKETTAATGPFVVGFVPRAFVSVYFVTMGDAVKEAADANPNVDVQIVSPVNQTDVEGQIKIIEDLTQKNVDLLAVAVNDPKAVVPSLKAAQDQGIAVIVLDSITPLPGLEVLSLIGSNNEDGGQVVGKNVLELQQKAGRKIKMAILEGVPGQYANEMRMTGFKSVVQGNPNIEIVASQPANWQRELAMSTMENILQAHPDLDIVWGVNDGMALGALKSVMDAGLKDRIQVLGYNGDKEAVEAVEKGLMYSTILQQPAEIGRTAITIAEMIRTGKKAEVKPLYQIPIVNVKQDNAAKWMPEK